MARWRTVETDTELTPEQEEQRQRMAAINASVRERRQRSVEEEKRIRAITGGSSYTTDRHGQVIRHESPSGRNR